MAIAPWYCTWTQPVIGGTSIAADLEDIFHMNIGINSEETFILIHTNTRTCSPMNILYLCYGNPTLHSSEKWRIWLDLWEHKQWWVLPGMGQWLRMAQPCSATALMVFWPNSPGIIWWTLWWTRKKSGGSDTTPPNFGVFYLFSFSFFLCRALSKWVEGWTWSFQA